MFLLSVCTFSGGAVAADDLDGYRFNVPTSIERDGSKTAERFPRRTSHPDIPDLSGRWKIVEADKSYVATLDSNGNGRYTWQNGKMVTTHFSGSRLKGTWHQTGNDREGGFEVVLSEDGNRARGIWWYTRVGDQDNIPPREWGGNYTWRRLPSDSPDAVTGKDTPEEKPSIFNEKRIQHEEGP